MTAGKYIVLFKPDTTEDQVNLFMTTSSAFTSLQSGKSKAQVSSTLWILTPHSESKIQHTYNMPGFKGFAAELSSEQLADFQSLKNDKSGIIDSIEADSEVHTQ
ncbi:hypothetical protein C8R45DRAFT_1093527 [Mycena sanguinolenta]|nr:hypothetical protein C8R45DRAFT_1093527 [Mycena sanguinolenta]